MTTSGKRGLILGLGLFLTYTGAGLAYDDFFPPTSGAPEDFAVRRAGAKVGAAIRIVITNEGLYRVTQPELTAIGVPAQSLTGSVIRLFHGSNEVAIRVSSPGLWSSGDYLLFWGQGWNGYYSAENVYWLGLGGSGLRMQSRNASPYSGVPYQSACTARAAYHRDFWYQELYRPNDVSIDHWFAEALRNSAQTTLTLSLPGLVPGTAGSLEARFHGYSVAGANTPDHLTRVWINGVHSADFTYLGQNAFTGSAALPAGRLAGVNTITMQQILQSGVSVDYAFLEKFHVNYRRALTVDGGRLIFTGPALTNNYQISGLPAAGACWTLGLADSIHPVLLMNVVLTPAGGGRQLQFGAYTPATSCWAIVHADAIRPVASLTRRWFRDLGATWRQADYIVVCPRAFRSTVYRLLTRRHLQGLRVAVAPIEDIYDEFGYGIADAGALKQFLGYAYHHWRPPAPRYVLLVGSGSFDPRHNVYHAPELIPVHLGPTVSQWSALEGWFAQVDGDDHLADFALGRLPVETEAQCAAIVDKIAAFEDLPVGAPSRKKYVLAADNFDSQNNNNFWAASETLRANYLAPRGYSGTQAYLDTTPAASVRQLILSGFNHGARFVNYFGHGAADQWAAENLLHSTNAAGLQNTVFPLLAMLTCQNGAFHVPTVTTLAEAFLRQPGRGAAVCLASSSLSTLAGSEQLSKGFYQSFTDPATLRIGESLRSGFQKLYQFNPLSQELLSFELLGDPATRIAPP